MAWASGLSERDQRRGKELAVVDAAQARESCTGVFWLREKVQEIMETHKREVRDLPWSEYRATVVIELYRVCCPDCGIRVEKVALLPSKALLASASRRQ